MALVHHDATELMAATDWGINGTLLDADGQPLDLSNATLTWTLIGPQGRTTEVATRAEPKSGRART